MKKIFLLVFIMLNFCVNAQEIELMGLRLYKGTEQNIKLQRMEIGLLLKDSLQVVSLSPTSKIELLQDNKGKNLKVPTYKNQMINFQQSQLVDEGLGILIEAGLIPDKGAKNIQLRGQLIYNIIDEETEKSMILYDVDFNNLSEFLVNEQSIHLRKGRFNDSRKGSMISYRFKNNSTLYNIKNIKVIEDGTVLDEMLEFTRFTNDVTLAISEKFIDKKYDLKITYNIVRTKSIPLNKKFGLGL